MELMLTLKNEYETGWGVLINDHGAIYEGYFKKGLFHGRGRIVYPDGRNYVGDWKEGKAHGLGILNTACGMRYEG